MKTLITAIIISISLYGQEKISVGDDRVNGQIIKAFTLNWTAHDVKDGERKLVSTVDEIYDIIESEGRQLIKFTQAWNNAEGKNLFTTVRSADRKTMANVAFHSGAAPGSFGHLDFDGRYVTGFFAKNPNAKAISIGHYLPEPVFSSFSGVLYATLPLDKKSSFKLPTFGWHGENPNFHEVTISFVRMDEIEIPKRGKVDAYILANDRMKGFEFWISQEAPYFLRLVQTKKDGSMRYYEVKDWDYIKE